MVKAADGKKDKSYECLESISRQLEGPVVKLESDLAPSEQWQASRSNASGVVSRANNETDTTALRLYRNHPSKNTRPFIATLPADTGLYAVLLLPAGVRRYRVQKHTSPANAHVHFTLNWNHYFLRAYLLPFPHPTDILS